MKRTWMTALLLAAAANAWADKTYSMADLEALQKSEGWAELVEHLGDVPPSKRDAKWDAAAEAGTVGYLAGITDASAALATVEDLTKRFPTLKKSKLFMQKRAEVAIPGFELCYQGRGQDCHKQLELFVGDDRDMAMKAGNLVIRKQMHYAAVPFFKRAVAGRPGAPECKEETLQRATLSALGLPASDPKVADAQAVLDVCFNELKEPVIDALAKADSYTRASACPLMLKKNAVTGLMKARCEAAQQKK